MSPRHSRSHLSATLFPCTTLFRSAHAALYHPAGQEAPRAEFVSLLLSHAVQRPRGLGLAGQFDDLRRRGLHAKQWNKPLLSFTRKLGDFSERSEEHTSELQSLIRI